MTHPDFRALCAELLKHSRTAQSLLKGEGLWDGDKDEGLFDRADAALAALQQGALSEEKLEADFRLWWKDRYGQAYFGAAPLVAVLEWAQHLLTRYGAQAVPVAVAERLPGEGDCSVSTVGIHDCCWAWHPPGNSAGTGWWGFEPIDWAEDATHWLPHWALPLPEAKS